MLLTSDIAQTIYSSIKGEPIIDYHTHLPATEILSNHRFADLWELWLKYDHYKWRLMRGCGVEERFITGEATPWEKFNAFAEILPLGIGNPVYQWVHMELKAVFNIHLTLNRTTAQEIWENANQQLENNITVGSLIKQFNVKLIGTTDDPADSLKTHIDLAEANYPAQILPTFRPDRFHSVHQTDKFTQAISALSERLGTPINTFSELLSGLKQRHDDFAIAGCLISDHGLDYCPTGHAKISELDAIMAAALSGKAASQKEWEQFAGEIMRAVAHWNTEKDWTMQLHLGPQRGVNTRLTDITGADSGFDTMGSWQQTAPLISFLNELSHESKLPKTIVYNLNPVETEPICAALQNFQEAPLAGKVQYGWRIKSPLGKCQTTSNSLLLLRKTSRHETSQNTSSLPSINHYLCPI